MIASFVRLRLGEEPLRLQSPRCSVRLPRRRLALIVGGNPEDPDVDGADHGSGFLSGSWSVQYGPHGS